MNRKIAFVAAALVAAVGFVVVAPPASAAVRPVITGTTACDADTSTWTITWTVTNPTEDAIEIRQVSPDRREPIGTFTGIAAGDTLPAKSAGSLTGTATVHSYFKTTDFLAIGLVDTPVQTTRGVVDLPVCGDPVMPTATFQSRCDDLLVSVTMAAGGYTVPIEVWSSALAPASLRVEPGGPTQTLAVPWNQAGRVTVNIDSIGTIGTAAWQYPPACMPPSTGVAQFFSRANGRFVTAYHGQAHADAHGASAATSFELHDVGGGDIALLSLDADRFMTVSDNTSALELGAVRVAGDADKFQIVTNADGSISLRSKLNGKYVSADSEDRTLTANRDTIGPWEKFTRYAPGVGPNPILAGVNDRFVTAESAGAKPLIANRQLDGLWENFQIINLGNGNIAVKSVVNGKYVCAESAGRLSLVANRTAVGPWETFKVVRNIDGTISLQAKANNRYVTAESAGKKPLIANRTAIGPWEKFYITL
ncbi:hypothetical protein DFJ67_2164 [Asanoa ferruginea]|uniref:Ricin-type beta-trefoil lectin protein n=1 Tax=Asanoa ferruginea TaxID=53367 RepID=A0A3D9ZIA0_9ACTN|nr:hypothetical protein [Asanoa ferruginea]REF96192.1 hypothetical protein DFJ67_2164 [Asanoa ferruginea]GIF49341.1 hypothetical protein Afe04nite_38800 [Asanoa ferruginea]